MEIVLLILKIIGLVLLILLGLVLLTVLLVVFFPISYKMTVSYQDNHEEKLVAKAKVHWLFHLLSVTLDYGAQGKRCVLRLLGIPITDFLNPGSRSQKKPEKGPKPAKAKKTETQKTKTAKLQNETRIKEQADQPVVPKSEETKREETKREETKQEETKSEGAKNDNGQTARKGRMVERLLQKCREIRQKGMNVRDRAEQWIEILGRERTKAAIRKAKDHVIRLLKHILPRKWKACITFGFEDPATTGTILGYYWMFIGLYGEHFICVPDFENKRFEGSMEAKGHIQVFCFLYVAYQFLCNKDLVYLRKLGSEINS